MCCSLALCSALKCRLKYCHERQPTLPIMPSAGLSSLLSLFHVVSVCNLKNMALSVGNCHLDYSFNHKRGGCYISGCELVFIQLFLFGPTHLK